MMKTCTRKGVPRTMSTQAPSSGLRTRMRLARTIPQTKPMTVPATRLSPDTATVIPRPFRKKGSEPDSCSR